jgi:hypothetical protein
VWCCRDGRRFAARTYRLARARKPEHRGQSSAEPARLNRFSVALDIASHIRYPPALRAEGIFHLSPNSAREVVAAAASVEASFVIRSPRKTEEHAAHPSIGGCKSADVARTNLGDEPSHRNRPNCHSDCGRPHGRRLWRLVGTRATTSLECDTAVDQRQSPGWKPDNGRFGNVEGQGVEVRVSVASLRLEWSELPRGRRRIGADV